MSSANTQHNLPRKPRVHITYDVETGGALEKVELPFSIAVLADLSGNNCQSRDPLKKRRFVPIDRDNINEVLQKADPRLSFNVKNRLTNDDGRLAINLQFSSLSDFDPGQVATQVAPLNELITLRQRLAQLQGVAQSNEGARDILEKALTNTEKTQALARALKGKDRQQTD